MKLVRITAYLRTDSPRFDQWVKLFGMASVPVQSMTPFVARAPDSTMATFYEVDWSALDTDTKVRIIDYLEQKLGVTRLDVSISLDSRNGIPILSDDVRVETDVRIFV